MDFRYRCNNQYKQDHGDFWELLNFVRKFCRKMQLQSLAITSLGVDISTPSISLTPCSTSPPRILAIPLFPLIPSLTPLHSPSPTPSSLSSLYSPFPQRYPQASSYISTASRYISRISRQLAQAAVIEASRQLLALELRRRSLLMWQCYWAVEKEWDWRCRSARVSWQIGRAGSGWLSVFGQYFWYCSSMTFSNSSFALPRYSPALPLSTTALANSIFPLQTPTSNVLNPAIALINRCSASQTRIQSHRCKTNNKFNIRDCGYQTSPQSRVLQVSMLWPRARQVQARLRQRDSGRVRARGVEGEVLWVRHSVQQWWALLYWFRDLQRLPRYQAAEHTRALAVAVPALPPSIPSSTLKTLLITPYPSQSTPRSQTPASPTNPSNKTLAPQYCPNKIIASTSSSLQYWNLQQQAVMQSRRNFRAGLLIGVYGGREEDREEEEGGERKRVGRDWIRDREFGWGNWEDFQSQGQGCLGDQETGMPYREHRRRVWRFWVDFDGEVEG